MLMGGRTMRGMVLVPDALIAADDDLESWVQAGVTFAEAEPPK